MSSAIRVARGDNGSVFIAAACGCAVKTNTKAPVIGLAVLQLLAHAADVEGGNRSGCVPLPTGPVGGHRD